MSPKKPAAKKAAVPKASKARVTPLKKKPAVAFEEEDDGVEDLTRDFSSHTIIHRGANGQLLLGIHNGIHNGSKIKYYE